MTQSPRHYVVLSLAVPRLVTKVSAISIIYNSHKLVNVCSCYYEGLEVTTTELIKDISAGFGEMGQAVERQDENGETVSIDALPDDTVAKIILSLDQRDRVSASMTCRRWMDITLSSEAIWRSVSLDLKKEDDIAESMSQAFIPWLLQRVRHVRDIHVFLECPVGGSNALIYGNVTSALTVASEYLENVEIEVDGQMVVGGWMASLRSLKTATLVADELTLLRGMENLKAFRELSIASWDTPLKVESKDVYPAGLQRISFESNKFEEFPDGLEKLQKLTALTVDSNYTPIQSRSRLRKLTCLKELELKLPTLPFELSSLTNLRALNVHGVNCHPVNSAETNDLMDQFLVLNPLRRLGILSIRDTEIDEFPSALLGMVSLRALYIDGNESLMELAAGAYMHNLKVLRIDWHILFTSYNVLKTALALESLHVYTNEITEALENIEFPGPIVSSTLIGLPCLQSVVFHTGQETSSGRIKAELLHIAIELSKCKRLVISFSNTDPVDETVQWLETLESSECGGTV